MKWNTYNKYGADGRIERVEGGGGNRKGGSNTHRVTFMLTCGRYFESWSSKTIRRYKNKNAFRPPFSWLDAGEASSILLSDFQQLSHLTWTFV